MKSKIWDIHYPGEKPTKVNYFQEMSEDEVREEIRFIRRVKKLPSGTKVTPVKEYVKKSKPMTKEEADNIIGNRARWEVVKMKSALSKLSLMNTPEENRRLEASKVWLKYHKKT